MAVRRKNSTHTLGLDHQNDRSDILPGRPVGPYYQCLLPDLKQVLLWYTLLLIYGHWAEGEQMGYNPWGEANHVQLIGWTWIERVCTLSQLQHLDWFHIALVIGSGSSSQNLNLFDWWWWLYAEIHDTFGTDLTVYESTSEGAEWGIKMGHGNIAYAPG